MSIIDSASKSLALDADETVASVLPGSGDANFVVIKTDTDREWLTYANDWIKISDEEDAGQ